MNFSLARERDMDRRSVIRVINFRADFVEILDQRFRARYRRGKQIVLTLIVSGKVWLGETDTQFLIEKEMETSENDTRCPKIDSLTTRRRSRNENKSYNYLK